MCAAVLDQRGFVECDVGRLDDVKANGFTTALIRHADHRAFADAWATGDNDLHFVGVDVETRDNDQVLFAIDDLEQTIGGKDANVSGAKVTIGGKRLGIGSGFLPVTGHDLRPLGANFPRLA
ncbi:hypothetical protein D9M71_305190 [compost metagenome]